ncbi:hypothetical protein PMIN07_004413 [Paraphaeosphaeria minitans]
MPRRKPPDPNLNQDLDAVKLLRKSLAALRLAQNKAREVEWRIMLEDRRKKQAELATQKEAEAKRKAYAEEIEMRKCAYNDQKRLALKTLGPFLALPAEVRNIVYSFCQEPKLLALKPQISGSSYNKIGEYFALTQVNRQIRAEFMPMHRKHTVRATMDPWEVVRFVDTFFPLHETGDDAATEVHIVLNLDPIMGSVYDYLQIPRFDLKPLLELTIYEPRFCFSFSYLRISKRKIPGFSFWSDHQAPRRHVPKEQLRRLLDESQIQGPGSAWAFFLAHCRQCELHHTEDGRLTLKFVTKEGFPISGVASWLDAWGFEWDSASLRPLNAMKSFFRIHAIRVTIAHAEDEAATEPRTAEPNGVTQWDPLLHPWWPRKRLRSLADGD